MYTVMKYTTDANLEICVGKGLQRVCKRFSTSRVGEKSIKLSD